MIASLPISNTSQTPAVVVSRSTDGMTWQNPVSVDPSSPQFRQELDCVRQLGEQSVLRELLSGVGSSLRPTRF